MTVETYCPVMLCTGSHGHSPIIWDCVCHDRLNEVHIVHLVYIVHLVHIVHLGFAVMFGVFAHL